MSHLDWTAAIEQLATHLTTDTGRWPDSKTGEYHATCPFCGKEAKRGQRHFAIQKDGKFICSVCRNAGGMKKLAEQLGAEIDITKLPGYVARPRTCYEYTDEAGVLLYEVVRYYDKYDEKQIRPRRPATDADRASGAKVIDGFVWNLGDVRRVLYRLPELIEAIQMHETIYLVEGEKDADSLRARGLTATTNAFGAGTWDDAFSSVLAGANVVLLRDNDIAGARRALSIATKLQRVASSVRCILLPDLPDKGDVTDWLDAGRNADDLLATIAAADDEYTSLAATIERLDALGAAEKAVKKAAAVDVQMSKSSAVEQLFSALDWTELDQLPPTEWLVQDIIPAQQIMTVYGPGGAGKSYLMTDLAMSLATQNINVVYVAAEDVKQYRSRTEAWADFHASRIADGISGTLKFVPMPVQLGKKDHVRAFIDFVRQYEPHIVIFDPLIDCMEGLDDSKNADIALVCGGMKTIRDELGATVLVVHHTGWSETRERGGSVLRNTSRIVASLKAQDEKIIFSCEKINIGKPFDPMRFVLLNRGKDEQGNDLMVLVPANKVMTPVGAKPTPQQFNILELLDAEIYSEDGLIQSEIVRYSEDKNVWRILNRLVGTKHIRKDDMRYTITDLGRQALSDRDLVTSTPAQDDEAIPLNWSINKVVHPTDRVASFHAHTIRATRQMPIEVDAEAYVGDEIE